MPTLLAAPRSMSIPTRLMREWRRVRFHPVVLMMIAAFALRMIVVLIVFRDVASPAEDYQGFGWEMGWVARSIASGAGFSSPFAPQTGPTALIPPLYPYLLAGVFRLFGLYSASSALAILSLNSVLSALTCVPVFFTSRHIGGRKIALIAGWLWALYPFSVYYSATQVWDYSLTSLVLASCWWAAQHLHQRPRVAGSIAFGFVYGVGALSNPSILALFPILAGIVFYKMRGAGRRYLLHGCVMVVTLVLVITPWTVRNWQVLHSAIPMRDGFWLECWAGNHGDVSTPNPASSHPASNPAEMIDYRRLGEIAYLAEKRAMTLEYVGHHPAQTLVVSARRMVRFWTGFWSFGHRYMQDQPLDLPNLFFCTAVTWFMIRGVRSYWRTARMAAYAFLSLIIVFPLPYYLSHTSMDYRQPVEPEVVMLVAAGVITRGRQAEKRNDPTFSDEVPA